MIAELIKKAAKGGAFGTKPIVRLISAPGLYDLSALSQQERRHRGNYT